MSTKNWNEKKRKADGFTLIEVMVAIAILAVSVAALFNFQSNSILASAPAAKISVATLLAREQMALSIIKVEDMIKKGEAIDEFSEEGTFDQDLYPGFRWELAVRKIEIPPPPLPEEGEAAVVQSVIQLITDSISEAIREVRLKIFWVELEVEEEGVEGVTHIMKSASGAGSQTTVPGAAPTTPTTPQAPQQTPQQSEEER